MAMNGVMYYIANMSAHRNLFAEDLTQRAYDKWVKSKSLPRKQKKLMRKDAMLDFALAEHSVALLY